MSKLPGNVVNADAVIVTYTAKVVRRVHKFYIRHEGNPNEAAFARVFPTRQAADEDDTVKRVKAQGFAVQYHPVASLKE